MTFGWALTPGSSLTVTPEEPRDDYPQPSMTVIDDFDNRSTGGITDTFNRTVQPGWGTSDYGAPWSGSGGSCTPATGARIASGVPTFTYHWVDLPHEVSSEFTVEVTEFDIGSGFNNPAVGFNAAFGTDWDSALWASIGWNTGEASLNVPGGGWNVVAPGFLATTPHKWHVLIDSSNVYANVWPLSGSEPVGWMLTAAHTAPTFGLYDISLGVQGGSPGAEAYASFRNLDVAGVLGVWTSEDPFGLGLMSDYAAHWANPSGDGTGTSTLPAQYGVRDGVGWVRLPTYQTASSSSTVVQASRSGQTGHTFPWGVDTGDGIPPDLFRDPVTWHIDIMVTHLQGTYMEMWWYPDDADPNAGGAGVAMFYQNKFWSLYSSASTPLAWVAQRWYRIKWYKSGAQVYMKAWQRDFEAEPAWMLVVDSGDGGWPWTPGEMSILMMHDGYAGAPAYVDFAIDNWAIEP